MLRMAAVAVVKERKPSFRGKKHSQVQLGNDGDEGEARRQIWRCSSSQPIGTFPGVGIVVSFRILLFVQRAEKVPTRPKERARQKRHTVNPANPCERPRDQRAKRTRAMGSAEGGDAMLRRLVSLIYSAESTRAGGSSASSVCRMKSFRNPASA